MTLALGLSWWLAPNPHASPPPQSRNESWKLPAVSRSDPEKLVAAIVATNLWGSAIPKPAELPLIAPEWRFSGVTVSGQERFVLVTIEGQSMQTLKAGDQLPGGAKILKIYEDHLCLLVNNKKRKLDIF